MDPQAFRPSWWRWPRAVLEWLRAVPIADPVGRNHAAMLQLLLVFMGIYQPLLLLNSMWRGSGQDPLLTGAALLNTVVMWACFVLLRRGHLRFAAGLFVAASLLLVGYGYLRWGLQAQLWGQLGQLLPILVGGLVLSRRALWLAAASLALLILLGAWRDAGVYLFDPFMVQTVRDRALHMVVVLLAITAVLDLAVASLRTSLKVLQQRNVELARARDRLQLEMREKDRAREQLVHAQKMEVAGRLASGIAHDFNHLLGLVMGYAAQGPHLDDVDGLRKALAGAESAARRAAAVSRQLLDFSRREPPRLAAFDLGEMLARTQPMLQQMCPAGVELELDLPATPQLVRMDRAQLELVLLNLAANAVQAMEGSGRLRIGLEAVVPGSADVLVSDTGPGMGAEVQARCFEPFFTTKASGHGTGLGLAVAANMIEASGGKLSVDGPGPGCTMRIRVPRWVGDAAPAPTMIGSAR